MRAIKKILLVVVAAGCVESDSEHEELRAADCYTGCRTDAFGGMLCESMVEVDARTTVEIKTKIDPNESRTFTSISEYDTGTGTARKCTASVTCPNGATKSCSADGSGAHSCNSVEVNGVVQGIMCIAPSGGQTCGSTGCNPCNSPGGCTQPESC